MIDGWKRIAERLSILAGFEVTAEQARHLARRDDDPLPVKRVGRGIKPRVIVSASTLEGWAKREFNT